MKTNYGDMTIEQLEIENQSLMQKKTALREQQKKLAKVLDAKRLNASLAKDVKKLEEKHSAKLQVVNPGGIDTAEGVNGE